MTNLSQRDTTSVPSTEKAGPAPSVVLPSTPAAASDGNRRTGRAGHSDYPTLDMLRLDDAAKAMRVVWAGAPWTSRTPWEDLGEPSREEWRGAAAAAVQAYLSDRSVEGGRSTNG